MTFVVIVTNSRQFYKTHLIKHNACQDTTLESSFSKETCFEPRGQNISKLHVKELLLSLNYLRK